jgi:hypothetical protein
MASLLNLLLFSQCLLVATKARSVDPCISDRAAVLTRQRGTISFTHSMSSTYYYTRHLRTPYSAEHFHPAVCHPKLRLDCWRLLQRALSCLPVCIHNANAYIFTVTFE